MNMPAKERRGFTLIETLISMSILAIVTALIWGSFSQTSRNRSRMEERMDRFHVYRVGLETLARELTMAFTSVHMNPNELLQVTQTVFKGSDRAGGDRIDFTSFSNQRLYGDSKESDQNELSYFVARHPEDSSIKVLARRESHRIDEDPLKGGRSQILMDEIEDFQIRYFDPTTNLWVDSWDTLEFNAQPNRLPSQIEVVLTVPHPNKEYASLKLGTRVNIPIQYALNHTVYKP